MFLHVCLTARREKVNFYKLRKCNTVEQIFLLFISAPFNGDSKTWPPKNDYVKFEQDANTAMNHAYYKIY